ncbi:MAG: ADP-ribosylglycohydrolase family protein, partial [Planctomycetota bacterium]|nr:ADP-ribosylglycohydrolase family protein [Planctomycetota bacterium]
IQLENPECRYTDDSVLTMAVAEACLGDKNYAKALKHWSRKYPRAGYGGMFLDWFLGASNAPYNSYGNGSAMRVSSVGWLFKTLDETLDEAKRSAEVTHNHPEGIKGAQSVAGAIFMGRTGKSKEEIREWIKRLFGYDLDRCIQDIRPGYAFDATCQGSVPEAIIAFLESNGFEDALRLAISLGGDTDTIACITGSMAEAFYGGVPESLWAFAKSKLDPDMLAVVERFINR